MKFIRYIDKEEVHLLKADIRENKRLHGTFASSKKGYNDESLRIEKCEGRFCYETQSELIHKR